MGDVNVQVIMEQLGGGGHLTMAGAQLRDASLKETKQRLMDIIHEYHENQRAEARGPKNRAQKSLPGAPGQAQRRAWPVARRRALCYDE